MVIYIHGIGEHPPKEQWKQEWDIALFGKPMGERTSMAYWADILHGPAKVGAMRTWAIVESLFPRSKASRVRLPPNAVIHKVHGQDVAFVCDCIPAALPMCWANGTSACKPSSLRKSAARSRTIP